MKLICSRATNYCSIHGFGGIIVDRNVTCFIGENEPGKTALLEALWSTKSLFTAKFDLVQNFPSIRPRKYEPEQKQTGGLPATAVQVIFEFEDAVIATRSLLAPMASVADIPTIPLPLIARFQPEFYANPRDAAFKALGVG